MAGCTVGGEPALDNTTEAASSCSGEGCKTSSQSKRAFGPAPPGDFKALVPITITVGEASDKCCNTSGVNMNVQDSNCVDDVNNVCPAGRVLTACKGCNFVGNDDCSPNDGGGTGWVGGTCNGFSYQVVSGKLVSDDCSSAGCAPGNDAGICTFDWPGDNACPTIALTQNFRFDGAYARMCCQTTPSGYVCVPREKFMSCGNGAYSIPSWCSPCPGVDPSLPNDGAWDMTSPAPEGPPGEWGNSLDCGPHGIYDPPGPETECRRVLFRCSGIQVNALNGQMMQESCDQWP